jgi:DNA methylase
LRDYGVEGQLGLEATPDEYVDAMVAVFEQVRRVLRSDGTLWLNIGDSYAAKSRGSDAGWDKSRLTNPGRVQKAQAASLRKTGERHRGQWAGVKEKELIGIPWRLAFALSDAGWYRRAEIIWDKQNPMPEAVEDRPTRAHEQVFLFSKSLRYFYDFVAVREAVTGNAYGRGDGLNPKALANPDRKAGVKQNASASAAAAIAGLTARRNLRTIWRIASQPYTGAHFAVFPPDLVEPCVLAGTSAYGCCSACGAPWWAVHEKRSLGRHELPHDHPEYRPTRYVGKHAEVNGGGQRYLDVVTVDWKAGCDCGADVMPCVVLDPFMGSGTTALVARAHGRRSIGVELSPEYARLAADRLSQLSLLAEASA